MKISVVSGGFDPIHSGHISYINSAKKYGDHLIIALNSDEWLNKKKGKFFMPFVERKEILEKHNINCLVEPSNIDEDPVKNSLLNEGATPEIISKNLAELKANKVSQKKNENIVLGADSVISLNNKLIKSRS